VLEGLRGEDSIAELCRREGIVQNLYYRWSKEFLEATRGGFEGTRTDHWDLSPSLSRARKAPLP
jgi:transposase-like protein